MSLFSTDLGYGRQWAQVGDCYAITKKPRALDLSHFETIPFAPMDAMPQGGGYAPEFVPKSPKAISSGTYFENGDVLVAKITPSFENGKQALVFDLPTPFGYATTEVIPLHPLDTAFDRRFLFFYLLHPDIRNYIADRMEGSTARQRIPNDVLLNLPFPVFSPRDQTTICDLLELIQKARLTEIKLNLVATDLKRATMQKLFTRGLRDEPQKQTEIGMVPKSWEVAPLETLCEETDTVNLASEGERMIEYVDVSSVSRESLKVESTSRFVLKDAPGRARKRILGGDVIFATVRPTLLRAAYITEQLDNQVCSTAFCVLRRDQNRAFDKFIYYLVQRAQFVQQLAEIETGASYPAVTDRLVRSRIVPVPDIDEQRKITAILDTIDRKIDLHRKKRAVLDDLFKTLLHQLMTGKIHTADLDLSEITHSPKSS